MAQADFLPNAIRAPTTGVHPSSSTRAAPAELVAFVEGQPPLPILLDSDIEHRADRWNKVITRLPVHVTHQVADGMARRTS
jgi:hypothetical protein